MGLTACSSLSFTLTLTRGLRRNGERIKVRNPIQKLRLCPVGNFMNSRKIISLEIPHRVKRESERKKESRKGSLEVFQRGRERNKERGYKKKEESKRVYGKIKEKN